MCIAQLLQSNLKARKFKRLISRHDAVQVFHDVAVQAIRARMTATVAKVGATCSLSGMRVLLVLLSLAEEVEQPSTLRSAAAALGSSGMLSAFTSCAPKACSLPELIRAKIIEQPPGCGFGPSLNYAPRPAWA